MACQRNLYLPDKRPAARRSTEMNATAASRAPVIEGDESPRRLRRTNRSGGRQPLSNSGTSSAPSPSDGLRSNAWAVLVKRALAVCQKAKGSGNLFFLGGSLPGASPCRTAVDWQRRCIFIIWLNCGWCAIRMEISPARDD